MLILFMVITVIALDIILLISWKFDRYFFRVMYDQEYMPKKSRILFIVVSNAICLAFAVIITIIRHFS